ncbi:MAG: PAS domain S-box protein [Hydrogenophaga sp.]|uniref:hybrid sensor histidine kinase/response regulator n=1 Tax=Hydrogenophaga sp. TaxID=1904254 RepID=UPI00276510A3|nr:PAS domain S-box protein [Hydrogenophaga sp.]MDP2416214.1 PAS domain S-box protein [Hydrogenophaga sp.]MDZ4190100.1 PAS domain S-box protein [Hydrogenophaga sp.]
MSKPHRTVDEDFSSLFNFLPIGAYRSSAEGQMLRANPALVRLNGYRSEVEMLEIVNRIGSGWYVVPSRRVEFRQRLERDGFVLSFVSEVIRHHSGERLWVSENAHTVLDAQGQLCYFEGTVEDITEAVRAQQALRQSEEQLRLITTQIPGMVFVVHVAPDGQRSYRFVSQGVHDIYGFSPEDLIRDAMLPARYRHPDDQPQLDQDMRLIAQGPVDLVGEFRIVLPSGQIKWLLRRSCAVASGLEGHLRVGVLLDITDRKQAEMALRQSEALWRLALESAGDGVWDWNLKTGEEFLSNGIKRMFGFDDAELVNHVSELDRRTHPDDVAQMDADRHAHFDGVTPVYRNEHRVQCKDGSWTWVLSRGMVIARDSAGQPLRMVGTHTDITELKQAEAQQRLLEAQLRESQKMEAIGTLAGGVAHDFNNLLAAILGNLALAREDVGEQHPAQESLTEVGRAALRARQLVQQILTFSRRQTQAMQRQSLTPLVEDALRLMRSLLPAGIQLVTRLPAAVLPVVADATQIQQVLMNLCTNAWQAMEGRSGQITVALREVRLNAAQALQLGELPSGAYACLSVADNGAGMDQDIQRRVFEPFFTTKPPGAGTGLGLAVVHGIVKTHCGAIDIESRTGEGARFDVYLPLASAGQALDAALAPVGVASGASAAPGKHIVYIDDYEAMVFLVGRLLRKQGYRVSTFGSGEEALNWLQAHPKEAVDLVVTDQNMPGMSGLDVALAVAQGHPGLHVAIVSGHVSDQLLADAAAVGVVEVMPKQDSMDALGDAIRKLLERTTGAPR